MRVFLDTNILLDVLLNRPQFVNDSEAVILGCEALSAEMFVACYADPGEITDNNRKTQALHLPRSVLEKFYHENAERVFKLKAAWEQRKQ